MKSTCKSLKHFEKNFLIGGQEVVEKIPFPVSKLLLPVNKISFGLIGKSFKHFVKDLFGLELRK